MKSEQPEALQLPTLPFAVFDEFGQPCEDRVRDHFAASYEALRAQIGQGVPQVGVVQQKPVAYLDIGAVGYIDLGTDLSTEQLQALPAGRHMLGIVGTFGADGYVTAPQQKPLTDEQDRALCEAHCDAASDEYFKARPQLDSDANRRIFCAGHRKAWIEWQAAHNIGEKK